jgi:hypothetical protein
MLQGAENPKEELLTHWPKACTRPAVQPVYDSPRHLLIPCKKALSQTPFYERLAPKCTYAILQMSVLASGKKGIICALGKQSLDSSVHSMHAANGIFQQQLPSCKAIPLPLYILLYRTSC